MDFLTTILFKKKERELFKKVATENEHEMEAWKFPNVLAPLFVVFVSLVCYPFLKEESQKSAAGFVNLLFNGSIALFSINRLSSIGVNLFKYNKTKEIESKNDTSNTRVKLIFYCLALAVLLIILYVIQVNKAPFNIDCWLLLQAFISIIFVSMAISLSKFSFLLQEKMLENTFAEDIRNETSEQKHHLAEKYK